METLIENYESVLSGSSKRLKLIGEKVLNDERISVDEGIHLFENAELGYVGMLANIIRNKRHGDITYFNRNFHIEPRRLE